ncbi:hypothetical protein COT27_02840 [Candidatus Kuenenbacteria bacterium CG08_land_8_20_14_0_20_37_23]|uniref:Glycosyltransferase RgtA/B/C/D-like domain-containing protein n=1 Tax=Candidatus Kuenenbacteria bacterium CG08_land_8_20_14_0_20_37_23 TaxID=1974617 RepID=A0A2M6XSF4_9BACT|nr:MAG: hypothetical protein COT27_02840 [Candidatus Kuenenbacteria bacterium CG08_land_8_20_14_0_20_37_23]
MILFLLVFCIVFFCIYSYFNLLIFKRLSDFSKVFDNANNGTDVKFSSPDETANYFWISRIARGKPLYYFEELNGLGNNLVHPRSVNAVGGKIVPGSFLGMIIIYGFLAKIFGLWVVPYLTPFFSVLGIVFFYLLIKEIFQKKTISLLAAMLLSFIPPWLYYSSRGMYHNILFMSLLIMGIYELFYIFGTGHIKSFKFKVLNFNLILNSLILKYFLYFFVGLLIGLAIITRTAEIVWVGVTVIFIFALHFKKIHWPGFFLFLCGLYLPALILMYHNQILYGQVISAGYRSIIPEGGVGEMVDSGVLWQILITPFGFDLKLILVNSFNYLYNFLPYWSAPVVVGAFLFLVLPSKSIQINYKKRIIYFAYCLLLTAYLLIFYGSWSITDRIDQANLSLGTSYVRYWLPIYVVSMPFLAAFILQSSNFLISNHFKFKIVYRAALVFAMIILFFMPSLNLTVHKTDESLFLLKGLSEVRIKSAIINEIVLANDITVLYKQADKIFFPERKKIIVDLVAPADYEALARLIKLRNIYYYTFAPASTVEFISRRDFEPHGMKIMDGKKILGHDWIYKIICNK